MSHPNDAALTTTTPKAITAKESPRVEAFVRSAMTQYGLTKQEVKKRATDMYGSLEYAMQAMETAEAENKAAIERAFPNGSVNLNPEEVKFSQLRDDLMIRVWGGDLASYECYCFDFVNVERQYILTPDDVKIYSVATALSQSARVLSIEQSLQEAGRHRYTPGVIPIGKLTSFVKEPFSVLHNRTTRIVFSTYQCESLIMPH